MSHMEDAYLARTRLKRAILSCSRLVAEELDLPKPSFPNRLEIPDGSPSSIRHIADRCNRLSESADIVCQPSEPLDERWRSGWSEILADLNQLEQLIQQVPNSVQS